MLKFVTPCRCGNFRFILGFDTTIKGEIARTPLTYTLYHNVKCRKCGKIYDYSYGIAKAITKTIDRTPMETSKRSGAALHTAGLVNSLITHPLG